MLKRQEAVRRKRCVCVSPAVDRRNTCSSRSPPVLLAEPLPPGSCAGLTSSYRGSKGCSGTRNESFHLCGSTKNSNVLVNPPSVTVELIMFHIMLVPLMFCVPHAVTSLSSSLSLQNLREVWLNYPPHPLQVGGDTFIIDVYFGTSR